MKYFFLSLLLGFSSTNYNQQKNDADKKETPNKVENLTLPPDIQVDPDEGFVVIKADCKGSVKWLVLSNKPTKYLAYETSNTLILGVPSSGTITIFAIGLCDGKQTEYAKTVVSVKAPKVNPVPVEPVKQKPLRW
jgi:hypothetical protein